MEFDLEEIFMVIIRSLASIIVLFLVARMLGKKQVSQLSLFDYVIGISIGNFAAEITLNLDTAYINGVAAVLVFGFVAYFVSYITMKSIKLRRILIGVPTIIIQKGKILEQGLRKVKIDINDLLEQCRNKNYFDISEIDYALMEANGEISIMPKGENKPLTITDMNLKPPKQGLCSNVIIDTKIMFDNLKNCGKNKDWLTKEIKIKGYKDLSQILLATIDINEKLTVYEKNMNDATVRVLE